MKRPLRPGAAGALFIDECLICHGEFVGSDFTLTAAEPIPGASARKICRTCAASADPFPTHGGMPTIEELRPKFYALNTLHNAAHG